MNKQLFPGKLYVIKHKPKYGWWVNFNNVLCFTTRSNQPCDFEQNTNCLLYISFNETECYENYNTINYGTQKIASFLYGSKTLLCYNDNIERFIEDWKLA